MPRSTTQAYWAAGMSGGRARAHARACTCAPLPCRCAGDAATTCLSIDLVGKVLAVGNVLGRTIIYILETSEHLCELRCACAEGLGACMYATLRPHPCVLSLIANVCSCTCAAPTVLYPALPRRRSNASAVREVIFNKDTTRLTTICSRQAITWDLATAAQVGQGATTAPLQGLGSKRPMRLLGKDLPALVLKCGAVGPLDRLTQG